MKRRSFFKLGGLAALGSTLVNPIDTFAGNTDISLNSTNKKAKNIIFMVSDGMIAGTMNLADKDTNGIRGKKRNRIQLYIDNKVSSGIMDMASASSIGTVYAAASSS